jgi:hypothetical protein
MEMLHLDDLVVANGDRQVPKSFIKVAVVSMAAFLGSASFVRAAGELTLTIVDSESRKPIPCRMHVRNDKDKPQRAGKMIFFNDHFVFPGTVKLKLPRGTYHYEIEHGPEYVARNGYFVIEDQAKDVKEIDLKRACDLAAEGWWSGDLHVHRPTKDAELLMLVDDLHVAGFVTWPEKKKGKKSEPAPRSGSSEVVKRFDGNRFYDVFTGESTSKGGTLLFLNLTAPLEGGDDPAGSQLRLLSSARQQSRTWIDAARVTAWDLPLWLATGRVDSIELCDDQFCRAATNDDPTGKPRDKTSVPGPAGVGRWTHQIYYHVLNCGLRIPPSAGSGSGEALNPVGYNRVYVWVDKLNFNYQTWWEGFRLGRSVVTNGPLIQPVANTRRPGHVFKAFSGEQITLEIALNLSTREQISYLELVKDGRVVQSMRFADWAKTGRFAPVEFEKSGWILVRAVVDNEETYRFATSAPWYVEIGDKKHISKESAQFFLDWLGERRAAMDEKGEPESDDSKKFWADAKTFWENLVAEGE